MRQLRKVTPYEVDWTSGEFGNGFAAVDPFAELLGLPAELVPDLPEPVTLWLELEGAPARVVMTTRERASPEASLADVIVFEREELRALAIATQADRLWRKDLLGLCFDKWRRPAHRVTLAEVLAGANPDAHDWTLARVLSRLGATVESFEIGEASTESRALSAAA